MANLKRGSSGDDVKKLQEALNSAGYSLDTDGIYGSKTENAVMDYQRKNNLDVDGIAGENTLGSLYGTGTNPTAPTEPVKTTTDYLKETETARPTYQQSQAVTDAAEMLKNQESMKPGAYQGTYQQQIEQILADIQNRKEFSYDFNADPIYQQYKDQYMTQGQLAAQNAMAEAAALSGGFDNSYAQQVAQQTNQSYLQQLNNVIPELYDAAYRRYQDEGDRLRDNLAMYQGMDQTEYGRYMDDLNTYYNDLNYYYGKYNDMSEQEYNRYLNDLNAWNNDRNYWFNKQQAEQDQANWERQFAASLAKGGGSGGGSSKSNGTMSKDEVWSLAQTAYGVDSFEEAKSVIDDAYYAGYITAAEAKEMGNKLQSGTSGAIDPLAQAAILGKGSSVTTNADLKKKTNAKTNRYTK